MRTKFKWQVQLQAESGQMVNHEIANFWDPTKPDAAEAVMRTAKGERFVRNGSKEQFFPIKAEYVGPVTA